MCKNYLGGGAIIPNTCPLGTFEKSRWLPLTVIRAISRQSHDKIGDCEQSTIFIIFKIAAGESPGRLRDHLFRAFLIAVISRAVSRVCYRGIHLIEGQRI